MKTKKKIKTFLKEIKEKEKYKVVNGLFIVKYEDNGLISHYIGEIDKKNIILSDNRQLFYKEMGIMTSGLGIWKPLNIKFDEKEIETLK